MALTVRSTVGDWLDHPVGGRVLATFLAQGGATPHSLTPARGLALEQLVAMSGVAPPWARKSARIRPPTGWSSQSPTVEWVVSAMVRSSDVMDTGQQCPVLG